MPGLLLCKGRSVADIRTLANLVETRAKSDGRFDVYRGSGPDVPTRNYVVLYSTTGNAFSTRHSGSQSDLGWSFRAVCVGLESDDKCLYVVRLVRNLFRNWTPVPSEDFTSWFEEANDEAPLIRDDAVPSAIRYSLTLPYTLTTRSY